MQYQTLGTEKFITASNIKGYIAGSTINFTGTVQVGGVTEISTKPFGNHLLSHRRSFRLRINSFMANPNTRETLKQYALRNLGKPVIEINASDEQLEDRIDEALQYYAQYHYDGIRRTYLKYQNFRR